MSHKFYKFSRRNFLTLFFASITLTSTVLVTTSCTPSPPPKRNYEIPIGSRDDGEYSGTEVWFDKHNDYVEQGKTTKLNVHGFNWRNATPQWSITPVEEKLPEGIETRIDGIVDQTFFVTNDAKTFFEFSIEVTIEVRGVIAKTILTCEPKGREGFIESILPASYGIEPITEEEQNEKNIDTLAKIARENNDQQYLDKVNEIENSNLLDEEEKKNKIDELALEKHIQLVDQNILNQQKDESIKGAYDQILNAEGVSDQQKLDAINEFNKQIDSIFLDNEENFLTVADLNNTVLEYIEQNEELNDPVITETHNQIVLNNFINDNQLILKSEDTSYEDLFGENPGVEWENYSYENTEKLSECFELTDYFNNPTYEFNEILDNSYQIFSKVENIERNNDDAIAYFTIEYCFYNFNSDSFYMSESTETEEENEEWDDEPEKVLVTESENFSVTIENPKHSTIEEFYSEHTFSLNQDYSWDDLYDNYFYEVLEGENNLSDKGYSISCSRPGTIGYENWDIRNYYSHARSISSSLVFNPINEQNLSSLENKSVVQLKNENIITDFKWSIVMHGEGTVMYDDAPWGQTPYDFVHNAVLTNTNSIYTTNATGGAPGWDGAENHRLHWEATIDESSVFLKKSGEQYYLHYNPNSIYIQNYFCEGEWTNGGANNWYEGNFNTISKTPKLIPYELDLEKVQELLMIDDKAYHVSDYPQFKVSLNMLNLTFDENNPIMDNDKVYGGISYQLKIQDLLNGVSSVFSKVQDTLLKEVTDEMIQNQINRIIDGCKVFLLNINKQINLKNMYYAKLYFCRIFGYTLIALEIIELALIVAYTTTFQFHVVAYVIIELVLIGVSIFMNALDIEESEETIKFLENSILAYEKTTQKYVFKYEQIIDVLEKTKNSNPSNDKKYTELMNFYIKNSNLYMANEFYTLSVDLEYVKSLGIGAGVYLVGAWISMSIESLGKKITEKAQKKMSQSILKISNGLSFFTGVMSTIEILYEILLETIIFFTKGERDFSDKFYILQQYAK